jgi:3'-phosphoadenosine 5'-phosphosulfate sulfotransferase (PAPS reductase)/FAD synthetase
MEPTSTSQHVRHILSLSGGKDSTALAIYMRDRIADMEYVFCDTEKELPETYEYLNKLAVYLGKPITYLKHDGRGFDELLLARKGFLPSPQVRWCTESLKIKPYERYLGDYPCYSYIGIRADELYRKGYISTKPNIIPKYPFIENGIKKDDVFRILEESGLGIPEYYKWRSRSGCYFCFFQQKNEWVGLLENHPDLFEQAKLYEREDPITGERYTWSQNESLNELQEPSRIEQIRKEHEHFEALSKLKAKSNLSLVELFDNDNVGEDSCLICHL